jgi:hypothetical protein
MSGQANLKILIFPNNCLKSDTYLSPVLNMVNSKYD